MTLLAGEPARTLALAASLEALGTALHRAAPPPPGHATGVDPRVAGAHSAAARAATVAIARLADRLLTDADLLYLVTARHHRADDQAAAALGTIRPGHATTSGSYPQLRSRDTGQTTCRQAGSIGRSPDLAESVSTTAGATAGRDPRGAEQAGQAP